MTNELKDIRRADLNHEITLELRIAMDRNPDLNVREVLDLVVTSVYRDSSCHNKTNEEMLYLLQKYNRNRDLDSAKYYANYHGKVDA